MKSLKKYLLSPFDAKKYPDFIVMGGQKHSLGASVCPEKAVLLLTVNNLESHTSKNSDLLLLEILQHIPMYMHIYNILLCSSLAQKC